MKTDNRSGRSLRRTLSLTAAFALVMTMLPAGMAAATHPSDDPRDLDEDLCDGSYDSNFDDVDADNPHREAILCAADHGIALGKAQSNDFDVTSPVRRDQMASFVVRWVEDVLGRDLEAADEQFADVTAANVHGENIRKLAAAGITIGDTDGLYHPSATVRRDAMATFIRRAIAYIDNGVARDESAPDQPDHEPDFPDTDPDQNHTDAEHAENISALAGEDIVVGFEDGTYQPRQRVLRQQMPSFIMRGYSYVVDEGIAPALAEITNIEVEAVDTPNVSTGDTWTFSFDTDMDTDTDGVVLTIDGDDDGDADFWVHCNVTPADTGDNQVAATCEIDEADQQTLTVVLLEPATGEQYPLELLWTGILRTDEGPGAGIDWEDSETTIG